MAESLNTARPSSSLIPWGIGAAGLGAMFGPTIYELFNTTWSTDEQGHGPIVLCIFFWLLYRLLPSISKTPPSSSKTTWGILFFTGFTAFILGRSQKIIFIELASIIPISASIILALGGTPALKKTWFPLVFAIFMVPLPGSLVDAATQPMKIAVSYVVEHILFTVGYPISRSGVTLQIGQYQLLVADACAGIHTLFTLEAICLLYINLTKTENAMRSAVLAFCAIPVGFTSNALRVATLTLITYYLGDEAGQGFLHSFAGMLLFLIAITMIILIDKAITKLVN